MFFFFFFSFLPFSVLSVFASVFLHIPEDCTLVSFVYSTECLQHKTQTHEIEMISQIDIPYTFERMEVINIVVLTLTGQIFCAENTKCISRRKPVSTSYTNFEYHPLKTSWYQPYGSLRNWWSLVYKHTENHTEKILFHRKHRFLYVLRFKVVVYQQSPYTGYMQ